MRLRLSVVAAIAAASVLVALPAVATATAAVDRVELVIFHGDGCPHCARALAFLDDLQARQPLLHVTRDEVWNDATNRALFAATNAEHGVDSWAVPTIYLGELVWIGFDTTVARQIEDAVTALVAGLVPEVPERTSVDVPLLGTVDLGGSSLVVATLVIGFVDGVNPCSFWVLSVLLALVLHTGSRRRIAAVGTTFLAVTSALYGLYMFGAYSALDYADDLTLIRVVVVVVAGTFGVLHLKEFVTHRGPSLTIADRRKPGMYRRMRSVARPDRPLAAVLGGTVLLAAGVSLAETPCTAGLPLLWTNLLSDRDVGATGTAALFLLYLLVFLLDELIVFTVAVVTMRATKLQEHHGRVLQLLSGTLMLTLALTMLVAPHLLESALGTAAVFLTATVVVAGVLLVDRHVRPSRPADTCGRRPAPRRSPTVGLRRRPG